MVKNDEKANIPWSVKGVSAEAREAVKRAAAAEGVTIGDWLSRVIREADDFPKPSTLLEETGPATTSLGKGGDILPSRPGSVKTLRRGVAERIIEAEDRIIGVVEPLQEIIQQLATRIENLERGESGPAPQRVSADPAPAAFPKTYRD